MLKRYLLIWITSVALVFSAAMVTAGTTPGDTVRNSVGSILAILKDGQLDKGSKREKMRAIINESFDFRAMSQRTLATNWKKATEEEKQKFTGLFSQLIENSYMGKLEAYTNEVVKYPGEKVEGRKAVVDTLIVTSSAEIPVNYKMYRKGENWLVYDVVIEGVSLISNYRSSYQVIVKREGFDGLLAKMQAKIKELESQPSSEQS
jgi:phospholipid transport system substrate-binding protein